MSKAPSLGKVFVPGGMPDLTYVPRTERDLERRLAEVEDNLCKLVVVTGSTKTGKTVLVRRVLKSQSPLIWIDGGLIQDEDDFWSECLKELDTLIITEAEETIASAAGSSGGGSLSLGVPGLTVGINAGLKEESTRSRKTKSAPAGSLRSRAVQSMQTAGATLVIDDFHYLSRPLQGSIVRALKAAIFDGFAAVVIAIPHRRYDAVRVEREMNGRLEPVGVPDWATNELIEIPQRGFPLLGMSISDKLALRLAEEAYGSPHLMQEFCKEIGRTALELKIVSADKAFSEKVFEVIAEHTGKVIFDKLASGPRQRSDRKQRALAGGGTADIYRVVLRALAHIEPGMKKVDYETLRSSIRELLKSDLPQAHEVTRVLEKMAEIASKEEMSVKVLDWDEEEQKLHITDPFFAFFLKWARNYVEGVSS